MSCAFVAEVAEHLREAREAGELADVGADAGAEISDAR